MSNLWKLTDARHRTYGGCQWGPGVTHRASGKGALCGPGWIYAYTSPRLAVLFNPIHAGFDPLVLWRAEGVVGATDHGLKVGCTELTTLEIAAAPIYSHVQRVAFAIFCAQTVYHDAAWCSWTEGWLSGTDRSGKAARAARAAARAAAAEAAAAGAAAAEGIPLDLDALALRALKWQP